MAKSNGKRGRPRGYKITEETKRKISETRKKKFIEQGYLNSPETRKKMSIIRKTNPTNYWLGKKRPEMYGHTFGFKKGNHPKTEFKKGCIPWCKGKKLPLKLRIKLSSIKQGIIPEKWNKFLNTENKRIRNYPEFAEWRKSVFERDNYECCCCLKKGYIHAHHIMEFAKYPEQRFDINNGLTLCKECHFELHKGEKQYG